jgi:hypothetical protein
MENEKSGLRTQMGVTIIGFVAIDDDVGSNDDEQERPYPSQDHQGQAGRRTRAPFEYNDGERVNGDGLYVPSRMLSTDEKVGCRDIDSRAFCRQEWRHE